MRQARHKSRIARDILIHVLIYPFAHPLSTFFWGGLSAIVAASSTFSFPIFKTAYAEFLSIYAREPLIGFIIGIGFIIWCLAFCVGGWLICLWAKREHDILSRVEKQEEMLTGFGVHAFSRYETEKEKRNAWTIFGNDLEETTPGRIRILAFTGGNAFGVKQVFEVLNNFQGEIRVLLLDPKEKKEFAHRAKIIGKTEMDLLNEHRSTIEQCKLLKSQRKQIKVKYYSDFPLWKMIITDQILYLQTFPPHEDVEKSPVYCFWRDMGLKRSSLYHPFTKDFENRWDNQPDYVDLS